MAQEHPPISFVTHPENYVHIHLKIEGAVARIQLDIQEDKGLRPGYELKLNSYDLSVDIELADAVQRLRFEHPEVAVVCIESAKDDVFSAGANIFMLGASSHSHKVNFCKFTNETRNNIEEATEYSNQFYVAALNGVASGGGYELPLACKEIHLIDDRKSTISLPEVPYLGVLPGTGGLTRVIDKRKVRRDHADIFCTVAEGVKGKKAVDWKLVDFVHPKSSFQEKVDARLLELAGDGNQATGIVFDVIQPEIEGDHFKYKYVDLDIDAKGRQAKLTITGPQAGDATLPSDPTELGCNWYGLRMWRELTDALLQLRFNYDTVGLVTLHTVGENQAVLSLDAAIESNKSNWFMRETLLLQGRALKMLDVTARSFFGLVTPGSCFSGSLLEVLLTCDRTYMLDNPDQENHVALSGLNAGTFLMAHGLSRLQNRFYQDEKTVKNLIERTGELLNPQAAFDGGLMTDIPDDLDWEDEIRVVTEERISLSPDALTGLEANIRFAGPETMETRIFGRLSAWQNWIFTRPNATGEKGALTSYGQSTQAEFDWKRT